MLWRRQSAVDLGTVAARAAIERAGISAADVENTIFGQVLQGGAGQNPARQVALRAGIGVEVPAETINRVCGSGMRAITLAESLIRAGDYDVVLAGGMESMTNAPYILRKARTGYRMGDGVLEDMMIGDGLQCAVASCHMGIHGGNVAAEEGISREEQDAWALRSHQRALAAQDAGLLAREIVPVEIAAKGVTTIVDEDESPRRDTSEEALARLKPAFDPEGTVTAGNAPGINDGAAALVVTQRRLGRRAGPVASGPHPRARRSRLGRPVSRLHAGDGRGESALPGWAASRRTSTSGRSTRHSPVFPSSPASDLVSTRIASMSMAAPSPSATRSAPAAPGSSSA